MKSIETKSIVTGKELDKAGWKHLINDHDRVVYGKGHERKVYQRLKGKLERYKFIINYKSGRRDIGGSRRK